MSLKCYPEIGTTIARELNISRSTVKRIACNNRIFRTIFLILMIGVVKVLKHIITPREWSAFFMDRALVRDAP